MLPRERGVIPKLVRQHILLTLTLRVSDPGVPSSNLKKLPLWQEFEQTFVNLKAFMGLETNLVTQLQMQGANSKNRTIGKVKSHIMSTVKVQGIVPVHFRIVQFSSVQFSCSVVSDSLRPRESQHTRPPCPSPTPGVHSDSRPSSR